MAYVSTCVFLCSSQYITTIALLANFNAKFKVSALLAMGPLVFCHIKKKRKERFWISDLKFNFKKYFEFWILNPFVKKISDLKSIFPEDFGF